jgi:glycosyltransferase involved in cell wall biosynthesis
MNILFYIASAEHYKIDYNYKDYFGWGGTEDCIFNLTDGLNKNGHDITVGGRVEEGEFNGIHCKSYETLTNELNHYDVVIGVKHIQFLKELTAICTWNRSYIWVSIANFHKSWNENNIVQMRDEELSDLKLLGLTGIVYNTNWHKNTEYLPKYNEILPYVIPPAIILEKFPEPIDKIPNSFIWSSDPFRGLSNLLDGWDKIKESIPDATLTICYPHYISAMLPIFFPEFLDYMSNVPLKYPEIKIVGSLPKTDLYKLMMAREYWVYPTEFEETYCITALEMMKCKVKIITTRTGALPEVVGLNGTFFDLDGDIGDNIVSAIDKYNLNPRLEEAYAWSNKNTYKHRVYEWEQLLKQL